MPVKIKDEPKPEYVAQSAAALVNETPPLVYLVGKCAACGLFPVTVQGGTGMIVQCGVCQKVVES